METSQKCKIYFAVLIDLKTFLGGCGKFVQYALVQNKFTCGMIMIRHKR